MSVIFGSSVSSRVHYCKRDGVYFTTLLRQGNGQQNGHMNVVLRVAQNHGEKCYFRMFYETNAPIAPTDMSLFRSVTSGQWS